MCSSDLPFHELFYHRYLQNETGNIELFKEILRQTIGAGSKIQRRHALGVPEESQEDYMRFVRSMTPCEPVIHIDDSDVVKP